MLHVVSGTPTSPPTATPTALGIPAALGTPAGLMLAAAESTRSDSAEPLSAEPRQGTAAGAAGAAWPWAIERPHRPVQGGVQGGVQQGGAPPGAVAGTAAARCRAPREGSQLRPTPSTRAGERAGSAAGPRETVIANEASTSIQPMRLPHTRDTDPGTQSQTRQTTRVTSRTTRTTTPLHPGAATMERQSQPSSVTILSQQQNVANRTTITVLERVSV